MVDNTTLPVPQTQGDSIACDDINGVKFQRVKLIHGADGINGGDISSTNPFPTYTLDSSGNSIGGHYTTSGTIAALNQYVELNCPYNAGGHIYVDGTFNGILTVEGTDFSGFYGARLLMRSGVGSAGTNKIRGNGTENHAGPFRFIGGGMKIRVKATSWTSGNITVYISTDNVPTSQFIIGPVHNAEEEALRDARAYSVGTNTQTAANGTYFKSTFKNPIGSGVNCYVYLRQFTNSSTSNLPELQFFVNPTALSGAGITTVTPNNLLTGGSASSVEFKYQIDTNSMGTPNISQVMPINGISKDVTVVRLLQEGESFGYQIAGDGGGLVNSLRASMTIIWYEEDDS